MKVYFFRHAQKNMDLSTNPDLSPEGHSQAANLLSKVLSKDLPRPTELLVSPKLRTQNTFKPLATHLNMPMQIQESLLEQSADEKYSDFRGRIENHLRSSLTYREAVVFICSHYDWVAEVMTILPSDKDLSGSEFSQWSPCQYAGFNLTKEGLFEFLELKRISK